MFALYKWNSQYGCGCHKWQLRAVRGLEARWLDEACGVSGVYGVKARIVANRPNSTVPVRVRMRAIEKRKDLNRPVGAIH